MQYKNALTGGRGVWCLIDHNGGMTRPANQQDEVDSMTNETTNSVNDVMQPSVTMPTALPVLVGTPKQVAWAVKIRQEKMALTVKRYAECLATCRFFVGMNPGNARVQLFEAQNAHDAARHVAECALTQASAAWWIEQRDTALWMNKFHELNRRPVPTGEAQ